MKTLSACLIVKNEELVIERCLRSIIPICNEIIVVDTGSNDNTINIVKGLIREFDIIKLYNFKWVDDFSLARNFSFEKAVSDYIMWVDADEVFTDNLNRTILKLKEKDFNGYDVIATPIQFYYSDDNYSCVNRERILLRENKPYWRYRVHEELIRNVFKNDINEYIIPFNDGYVFHEKKKESNFKYYFQIYCDELNKNKLSYGHHNLYYLTWMCSFYDNIMAKLYAFDVFMHLPIYKYEIDYREWFIDNLLNENEYEMLKTLSFFYPSFANSNCLHREINCNMISLFKTCKKLYEKNEYFAAFYGLNFIFRNKDYFTDYFLYEEKLYEYFNIILWNIGLINYFIKNTYEFIKKYPNNKIAIQNYQFSDLINNKINNLTLIINVKNNEWNLPHILYITKNCFKQRIIVTSKNIANLIDDDIIITKNKNELLSWVSLSKTDFYLYLNDDSILNINIFNCFMKNYYLASNNEFYFEEYIKNCIFTNNINKIIDEIKIDND